MADKWLSSRSSTRDDSFNNINNTNMDSNNTILESKANITVRANPEVEVNVQNSEVAALDNNNATLSNITTSQSQDLLTTVMAAIQAESIKQTAAFQTEVAKLTETLKAQFRQENKKLATSLTERFEAPNAKLRKEFNAKLQHEIQGVSDRADILKRDTDHGSL
jgi:DNA anti-recombination protein RmuC